MPQQPRAGGGRALPPAARAGRARIRACAGGMYAQSRTCMQHTAGEQAKMLRCVWAVQALEDEPQPVNAVVGSSSSQALQSAGDPGDARHSLGDGGRHDACSSQIGLSASGPAFGGCAQGRSVC